ncbi:MAG: ribonuclease E/G [Dongiaceae bacterium]
MTKRLLIDATHPEETRVVVLDGNRLDAFDFESTAKKQIKGNIYLAKVTRVEPSLQACFVDYGGNRHGFLAFNEIHPDYYQIPVSDREALLAQVAADDEEEEAEEEAEEALSSEEAPAEGETPAEENIETSPPEGEAAAETQSEEGETPAAAEEASSDEEGDEEENVETIGGEETDEQLRRWRKRLLRSYKIQEVIKKRQIMLVQVVKEERGLKGAAMTTYLSLAGRYCVLMPNSPRGGGISRKINSSQDRRRLRELMRELEIPDGMAMILRTAGADRPKPEIKRDCDYLLRLWNDIREKTLSSTAPSLIHEEGHLLTRAVRDLYNRDMEEILVAGTEAYQSTRNLMRQLTPSHAVRVKLYRDQNVPLFQRFHIESQLDAIHSNRVELKSGGYIVLNQTEALVAIDVNSGRATRERHIESTALKTNLEAAEEVARQLRLRDLAGLIVIDFIDMVEHRNQHTVERKFKEAVRTDRARMQIGRISPFGLLEMTRQRLRSSVQEISHSRCPTCGGSGTVRSIESTALHVLRMIEEEGLEQNQQRLTVYVSTPVAFYLLNQKRVALGEIEQRYQLIISIERDDELVQPNYRIERQRLSKDELPRLRSLAAPEIADDIPEEEIITPLEIEGATDETFAELAEASPDELHQEVTTEDDHQRRRGRRGRRGGRRRGNSNARRDGGDRYNRNSRSQNRQEEDGNNSESSESVSPPAEELTEDTAFNEAPMEENQENSNHENRHSGRGRRGLFGRFRRPPRRQQGGEGLSPESGGEAEEPSAWPETPSSPPDALLPSEERPAPKAPENVALVTDSPANPRQGWWNRNPGSAAGEE